MVEDPRVFPKNAVFSWIKAANIQNNKFEKQRKL